MEATFAIREIDVSDAMPTRPPQRSLLAVRPAQSFVEPQCFTSELETTVAPIHTRPREVTSYQDKCRQWYRPQQALQADGFQRGVVALGTFINSVRSTIQARHVRGRRHLVS